MIQDATLSDEQWYDQNGDETSPPNGKVIGAGTNDIIAQSCSINVRKGSLSIYDLKKKVTEFYWSTSRFSSRKNTFNLKDIDQNWDVTIDETSGKIGEVTLNIKYLK